MRLTDKTQVSILKSSVSLWRLTELLYKLRRIAGIAICCNLMYTVIMVILFLNQNIDKINALIRRIYSIRRGSTAAEEAVQCTFLPTVKAAIQIIDFVYYLNLEQVS